MILPHISSRKTLSTIVFRAIVFPSANEITWTQQRLRVREDHQSLSSRYISEDTDGTIYISSWSKRVILFIMNKGLGPLSWNFSTRRRYRRVLKMVTFLKENRKTTKKIFLGHSIQIIFFKAHEIEPLKIWRYLGNSWILVRRNKTFRAAMWTKWHMFGNDVPHRGCEYREKNNYYYYYY